MLKLPCRAASSSLLLLVLMARQLHFTIAADANSFVAIARNQLLRTISTTGAVNGDSSPGSSPIQTDGAYNFRQAASVLFAVVLKVYQSIRSLCTD